jgi:predicted RNA binding protein YcfA (HicA-like mRNA interferase family)
MATKKIKINFKMPTPTAAERLHAQQQKNRKAAGLPDPSEYKKKLDSMKKENYEEDDGPLSQEQLDEISVQLKASYVSGAKKQIKQSMPFTKKTDEYRDIAKNFIAKRQKGIAKANEEVELNENEDKVNARKMYHKHFVASMKSMASSPKQKHHQAEMAKYKAMMGDSFVDQVAPKKFAKFDKKTNEEVEQLDEYESKGGVYKHKGKYGTEYTGKTIETIRQKDAMDLTHLNKHLTSRLEKGMDVNFGRKTYHQVQNKNHLMNVHKNLPEEVEQLDEMPESSMKTRDVHSHLKKAGWELARSKGGHDVYKHPKAKHSIPVPRHNQLKAPLIRGIMRASKVEEQLEKKGRFVSGPVKQPYKSDTIVTAVKESFRIGGMGGRGGGRGNIYMYDRNPGPRDDDESGHVPYVPKTEHQKKLHKALTDLGNKMKETHPKLKEDLSDVITVFKKGTNVKQKIRASSYDTFKHHGFRKEAADEREYDYEGDMAKSDLRSIIHNAQTLHDMLDDNTNLAEWCQSKITLAEDYISTVTNYMRSEMNEEVKKNEYHIAGKHKFPTKDEHAVTVKHTESGREHVHSGKGKYLSKLIKTRYNINHYFEEVELDEKKNLPGLWANIRAKKARGESPAKPGDKDYPEDLESVRSGGKKSVKESTAEPTEGEMKGKQQGVSRKAQIVMNAAKGKKSDNPDKFQKDPELSSEIHKT